MVIVVIPARWGSTRFPGKPLAEIAGKPMIEHVYRRAAQARGVERVLVATDDTKILKCVREFGGEVVLTGEHRSGTDRVAEAVADIECDIVVNVQGDEPLIPSRMIEQVIEPFRDDESLQMASLKRLFREDEDPHSPQLVKVVTDKNNNALYFSRSLLPYPRYPQQQPPFLHIGIYAYRKNFLLKFSSLPSTPLEQAEGLEQLRALEHGYRIKVPTTELFSIGVDVPEDIEKVKRHLENDVVC